MSDPGSSSTDAPPRGFSELKAMLIPGEVLEAWAIQHRLFALTHRRIVVAATSGRFIALVRRLFGGFDPTDIRWQDLTQVRINAGILGATLSIVAESSADLTVDQRRLVSLTYMGLRRNQAEQVYRICQAHDQAWREKRRVREIEEMRARSGGVQILGGGTPGASPAAASADSSVERLRQAKEMLDAKLITDAEYEAIKARIINSV
jgi:hypothetical protein